MISRHAVILLCIWLWIIYGTTSLFPDPAIPIGFTLSLFIMYFFGIFGLVSKAEINVMDIDGVIIRVEDNAGERAIIVVTNDGQILSQGPIADSQFDAAVLIRDNLIKLGPNTVAVTNTVTRKGKK